MARLELNQSQIENLLYGASGPVYRRVLAYGERVEVLAKAQAPRETGRLAASINGLGPDRQAGYIRMRVGAPRLFNLGGQSVDYAFIVHEGHGVLTPKTQSSMAFFWERRGKFVRLKKVNPTSEDPYLWDALVEANSGADRFLLKREHVYIGPR